MPLLCAAANTQDTLYAQYDLCIVFHSPAQIACSSSEESSLSSLGHDHTAGACCRVRISLGLKPLSMENSADTKRKEFDARQKVQAEQETEAQAAALLERVQK